MTGTELTDRELEMAKREVSHVEYDEDDHAVVVHSTDYGVTLYQRFEATPVVKEARHGEPLLDVEVSEEGWATTHDGEGAGEASHEAYEAAREYARENARSIFGRIQTMHERQKENAS